MANNYYDATGILVLDKVTPVITALFGGMNLDASYPGNGQAYIARLSEGGDSSWAAIQESLYELANTLGMALPADAEETIEECLYLLAEHFGAGEDEVLGNLIEHHSFEDDADLDALFEIAVRLNDGHGLKAIQIEGAWHCDKPRLFEFSGNGEFIGKHVYVGTTSSTALSLGEDLEDALTAGDADLGAERVLREVNTILNGVADEAQREALKQKLGALLVPANTVSTLKWYAVTGRIPGDDEDSLYVFQVGSREDAIKAFEEAIWAEETDAEEGRESVFNEHGQYVFLNSIVVSDSPITDVA